MALRKYKEIAKDQDFQKGFKLTLKHLRKSDDKQAVNAAHKEYLTVCESLKGNFQCKSLRGERKVYQKDVDGRIVTTGTKRMTLGIRLYMNGRGFDIPRVIMDILRKRRGNTYVPSYTDAGGTKQHNIMEFKLKDSDDTKLLTSFERGKYRGEVFRARESLTIEGSIYLIECYKGSQPFNYNRFKQIEESSKPVSNPIFTLGESELLDEFNRLVEKGLVDKEGNFITPSKQPEPIEVEEVPVPVKGVADSNLETKNNGSFQFSCPVTEYLETKNYGSFQFSDSVLQEILAENKAQTLLLQRIADYLEKGLIPPTEVVRYVTDPQLTKSSTPAIKLPPKENKTETVIVVEKESNLRARQMNLEGECNDFMKMVILRCKYHGGDYGKISNDLAKTVIFEMHEKGTEFNRLMNVFLEANEHMKYKEGVVSRGREPNKISVKSKIEPSNIQSWLSADPNKGFELGKDGIVYSKRRQNTGGGE